METEERLIRVGITQGDMNGIGYEVILKTFAEEVMTDICTPVIYGSVQAAQLYQETLADMEPIALNVITAADQAEEGKVNLIDCVPSDCPIAPGQSTAEGGMAAFVSLEAAVTDLKRGIIDTLVTAPINKHNIQHDGFHFPGHTEYLEACFGENGLYHSLMILTSERLRVALVTGHVPLSAVATHVTQEAIVNKLKLFNTSLKEDFGIVRPRIAVLSLNPHTGDAGLLGEEEETVIHPAMAEAEKEGVLSFGPYAADGFFGAESYRLFDGVLAMYHDQGLSPFKALAMNEGVNFTAGLPIIRTSPDHGTAYDIAGRNCASEASFRQAVYVSIDVCRNREAYRQATAHPLRKEFVDKNGKDNVRLDLTKEEPEL